MKYLKRFTAESNLGCPGIKVGPLYADLFKLEEWTSDVRYAGMFIRLFKLTLWIYFRPVSFRTRM